MIKKITCIAVALMLLLCLAAVPQRSSAEDYNSWMERLYNVPSFKFTNHENGVGCGYCPVYTAPYENAYRVNGNAGCDTNSDMAECGFINGWLFVRYQTNKGGYRVGYIPPSYTRGKTITSHTPIWDYVPAKVGNTVLLTDNPMMKGTRFATLYPGQEIHVLAKYTYFQQQGLDWWYIECYVDGQIARGFIDRPSSSLSPVWASGSASSYGYGSSGSTTSASTRSGFMTLADGRWVPSLSVWGTEYIGDAKVEGGQSGDRKIVRSQPNSNSAQVTVVYPGNRYPCYAIQRGNTGKDWYGIWIEADNAWGWISSGFSVLIQ